jgi:hypothetical protein
MEIDDLSDNDERLPKKPEINQHGTGLIKKREEIKVEVVKNKAGRGGLRRGAGRPKGSKSKITLALKECILQALDEVGGVEYFKKLAIENSSAFANLLGKVLPTTLAASESDGGLGTKITFTRVIVMPDGQRYIEGKTPLQIEAKASHELPIEDIVDVEPSGINDLDD